VDPERAFIFIDGNDKGGEHGYKDGFICHTLFWFGDPRDIVINTINIIRRESAIKRVSQTQRHKEA